MNIGLSLPFDYLNGTNKLPAVHVSLMPLANRGTPCTTSNKHGVSAIELQQFGHHASAGDLLDAAQSILDSGLRLTLHGYLTGHATSHLISDNYPHLLPLMEYLKEQHLETIMVVHAHANPGAAYQVLMDTTIRALQQITGDIHTANYPIRISLEINRYHGVENPGTTYAGLLAMAQQLNSAETGFCWDMGHTQSSVQQHRLSATPPPAFVRKVIHTHIHGLSPDGDTHRPLTGSNAHIVSGVNMLRSSGYKGLYNLELYPVRWGSNKTVRAEIMDSIHCLHEILS